MPKPKKGNNTAARARWLQRQRYGAVVDLKNKPNVAEKRRRRLVKQKKAAAAK